MRLVVLDVEAFTFGGSVWVIKELAGCCNYSILQASFKSPKSWYELSPADQKSVTYQTENVHGIHWVEGDLEASDLLCALETFIVVPADGGSCYFAKGAEKCKILSGIIGQPVCDLELLGCPAIDIVSEESLDAYAKCLCFAKTHNKPKYRHCAAKKVNALYNWLARYLDENKENIPPFLKHTLTAEAHSSGHRYQHH